MYHEFLLNSLPQPYVLPLSSAQFKSEPTDFMVTEVLNIDFTESGEHYWMLVKKIGMNTDYLAQRLAKWANIPKRDVGYSGLKDRHAVTVQWFSLRLPKGQLPSTQFELDNQESGEKVEVISTHWHNRKLNRNTHQANHFVITLVNVLGNYEDVDSALQTIKQQGVPNYFGSQRFGHQGNNIQEALTWFEQIEEDRVEKSNKANKSDKKPFKKLHKKQRAKQSLLLSAARSAIFNKILAHRVLDGSWNTGLRGEVFNLAGTGSLFTSDTVDTDLQQRLDKADIHPTGALWGIETKSSAMTQQDVRTLEHEVIAQSAILISLATGLETLEVKAARRALRLMPQNLQWRWQDQQRLQLEFSLPSGSFATSVLASLVQELA